MRTPLAIISSAVALLTSAQVNLGPGTRSTWVDAKREFKLGYGLHGGFLINEDIRLNAEGYLTPWEDVRYFLAFPSVQGNPGPSFETLYEYHNWGLNLDLEFSPGQSGWFVAAGLGYHSFHTSRTETVTVAGSSDVTLQEHGDRLMALDLGFGARWKMGPGSLRLAIMACPVGYNFDNTHDPVPLFETYGCSLSYQFRLGKSP